MSGYDDFNQYMSTKANKLLEQQSVQEVASELFSGLRININGRTETSLHELKHLITSNGGIFDHYVNTKTSIIIANQLPVVKRSNYRRPILNESWLLDCLKEGRLVEYSPYMMNSVTKSASVNIDSYFDNSRLHFISSLRDELRDLVSQYFVSLENIVYENVLHFDFDAFFASVSESLHPAAKGKPAAVCHGSGGTSDIASCNYTAREFGISNGMLLNKALELCPALQILPYEFEAYRKTAYLFFGELLQLGFPIEALSCDEAFVGVVDENPYEFASKLKSQIQELCGIPLSVGIGDNFLMAKLASKLAKPNGIYELDALSFENKTEKLFIGKLPGIGRQREKTLHGLGITSFADARGLPLNRFTSLFGDTQGQKLNDNFRGKDDKSFEMDYSQSSTSVGVNWGVRINDEAELFKFFQDLFNNARNRIGSRSEAVSSCSIKIMMSSSDAAPRKYLGHGICDAFSKSVNIDSPDRHRETIYTALLSLIQANGGIPKIRGCTLGFKFSSQAHFPSAPVSRIEKLEECNINNAFIDISDDDRQILDLMFYLDSKLYQKALSYVDKVAIKDPQRAIELKRLIEKRLDRRLNARMRLFT